MKLSQIILFLLLPLITVSQVKQYYRENNFTATITSSTNTCDCNGTATVLATGGTEPYTYLWSDPNSQTTETATGLCVGTYTVTVTGANGCTDTESVEILHDCSCTGCDIVFHDGDDASNFFTQNGSYTADDITICINGIFTVNHNITIQNNCIVYLGEDENTGENARINIADGYTLTINNSTLMACYNMWDGIYIESPNSALIVNDNSVIQDAKNAVVSKNGGVFHIDNAIFQHNRNNLSVYHYWDGAIHPGTIENTTFTGGNLLVPYIGEPTITGILTNEIYNFTIGDNNSFDNMNYGIRAKQGEHLTARNCDFTNCNTAIVCVDVKKLVTFENNNITDIADDGIYVVGCAGAQINDNQITNIGETGIAFENAIHTGGPVFINSNNISDTKNGIRVTNITCDPGEISNNNIFLITLPSDPGGALRPAGIKLEGCHNITMEQNTITSDNAWVWWTRGIHCLNTENSVIHKNTIKEVGTSILFGGSAFPSYLTCNEIGESVLGVALEWCGTGIGEQGGPDCADLSDNRWTNTTWGGWEGHTESFWSFGKTSKFYVRGNLGSEYIPDVNLNVPDPPEDPYFLPIQQPIINYECEYSDNCGSKSGKSGQNNYEAERKIANNEINYAVFPEEQEWLSKNYVYYKTKQDTAILDYNPVFSHFRDSMDITNAGLLYTINQMINDTSGNISQIIAYNNSITPENIVEENQKTVNNIYLNTFAQGTDSLTTIQKNQLISVAEQCPYKGGNAVFSARILLSKVDTIKYIGNCDDIDTSSSKSSQYISTNLDDNGELVPNGSFEEHTDCPDFYHDNCSYAFPWNIPANHYDTPDYLHSCGTDGSSTPNNSAGYQVPFQGEAYMGLLTYSFDSGHGEVREYIQAPLKSELRAKDTYKVKFYVSRAENFRYATDKIGAYFSVNPVVADSNFNPLSSYIPQICNDSGNVITDTLNWVKISGEFKALGGEKYITIGNFSNDSNTTVIDLGQGDDWAYYYIDSVSVYLKDSTANIEEEENTKEHNIQTVKLYPNPAKEQITIEFNSRIKENTYFELYDILGSKVMYRQLLSNNNKVNVSTKSLNKGVYSYRITVNDKVISTDKLIIIKK